MEIKVVYIEIHDATVDIYVLASRKNIDVPWAGGWGITVVVIITTYYAGGRLLLPGVVL